MDESTRWLVLRDLEIFPPPCHTSIVCQRDLSWEVFSGAKERRHEYVIDVWTGKSFGRIGSGRYLKYAPIPPVGMMRSPSKLPPPNKLIILCCLVPQFFGARIGRMTYEGMWELHSDALGSWIAIPSVYVEGWLLLP